MNKEKFIELSYLYLLDELDAKGRIEFENILMQDDELKNEFENIKVLIGTIRESKPVPASERVLVSARQNLMREIRQQAVASANNEGIIRKVKNYLLINRGFALSGLATFVFGVIVSYILLVPKTNQLSTQLDNQSDLKISNLQITKPDSENGEVEVKFDLTKPVQYKIRTGKLTSPNTLVAAMLTGSNPGIRIKSVSTIADQIKKEELKPDYKIKKALITSMEKDNNPVVRREALNVLNEYPLDEEIRDALLYVLSSDRNSGMRVAAINSLADYKHKGQLLDEVTRKVLNNKAVQDQSNFIRLRAAAILQEVY